MHGIRHEKRTLKERSRMLRHIITGGTAIACLTSVFTGCSQDNEEPPLTPPDRTELFTEGFESDLSHWEGVYMISMVEMFYPMRVTTDAARTGGIHSLTTDSNMTALYHVEPPDNRVESGTAGVEFYMMAQTPDSINFGVEIGQNPGSSGAVSPAFGMFFDPADSIKCIIFCSWPMVDTQVMIEAVQADRWYKCKVEVNMTDSTASFYLDDVLRHTESIASIGLMGIDRLLVFRGPYGKNGSPSSEGMKAYYVDDITLYKK
jgi:hypothetical protein